MLHAVLCGHRVEQSHQAISVLIFNQLLLVLSSPPICSWHISKMFSCHFIAFKTSDFLPHPPHCSSLSFSHSLWRLSFPLSQLLPLPLASLVPPLSASPPPSAVTRSPSLSFSPSLCRLSFPLSQLLPLPLPSLIPPLSASPPPLPCLVPPLSASPPPSGVSRSPSLSLSRPPPPFFFYSYATLLYSLR